MAALITGYRVRQNKDNAFVDIYIYDNLSSGAGYAISVQDDIGILLKKTEVILRSCECSSACHKCLKHYRNQFVHGVLDRFAGLELLQWGFEGKLADALDIQKQKAYIESVKNVLLHDGYKLDLLSKEIMLVCPQGKKRLTIYPAMWKEPLAKGEIFVSDIYMRFAKPYAVDKMKDFGK